MTRKYINDVISYSLGSRIEDLGNKNFILYANMGSFIKCILYEDLPNFESRIIWAKSYIVDIYH
jgi:hypothetical protein